METKTKPNCIEIIRDEVNGLYNISVDGEVEFECLAMDEVMECVREITER